MTTVQWPKYLRYLCLLLITSLGIGYLLGYPLEALCLNLLVLVSYHVVQLARFEHWLRQEKDQPPPDLHGYLNVLLDKVYYFQRKERKAQSALRNLLKRAQKSANALSDGYLTLNRNDALEWWNAAAGKMLGLQHPSDIGQPLLQLLRDPDFIRYFHKKDAKKPLRISNPNNKYMHLELELTRYGDSEKLLHLRDITQLIHLEQVRTDFIANVSHELRTPLTVLKGYVEILENFADSLPPAMRKGLGTMEAQVHRMQNLIEDLFTLTRLEDASDKAEETTIHLDALLQDIAEEARVIARAKNITVSLPAKMQFNLLGDPKQIRSALMNLVSNAVITLMLMVISRLPQTIHRMTATLALKIMALALNRPISPASQSASIALTPAAAPRPAVPDWA
jgi:two-component system phosphate regulon sensor histidine kinase PhoR